ncbi:MAG TPA: efflux RND transporter periplasmic adaptor subunit [Polyangia bacterium]|nr:efflux RND transporter periplasmic adaptor subunit [Polyangia bacterium]
MKRLIALALVAAACTQVSEARTMKSDPLVSLPIATVTERPTPRYLPLTGTLVANRKSDVASDGVGKVAETFVERGSFVQKGAPLARLDGRGAAFSASEARAMAQASRAQQELARSECERAERLFAQEAINRAEYDRMRAQCTTSQWSTSAATAREALAGKALGDATIRAPFAGMIAERFAQVGEYIRAGSPVATVVEIDPLRLELTVPEMHAGALREGQAVEFEVAAMAGRSFRGTIRYIGPSVRRASRDFVVEAQVANADHALRPGMFAIARVVLEEKPLPVVPTSALRQDHVFVVVSGRLEERIVQLGNQQGEYVAVLGGVRAGDRIAIQLGNDVRDGLRVE